MQIHIHDKYIFHFLSLSQFSSCNSHSIPEQQSQSGVKLKCIFKSIKGWKGKLCHHNLWIFKINNKTSLFISNQICKKNMHAVFILKGCYNVNIDFASTHWSLKLKLLEMPLKKSDSFLDIDISLILSWSNPPSTTLSLKILNCQAMAPKA